MKTRPKPSSAFGYYQKRKAGVNKFMIYEDVNCILVIEVKQNLMLDLTSPVPCINLLIVQEHIDQH